MRNKRYKCKIEIEIQEQEIMWLKMSVNGVQNCHCHIISEHVVSEGQQIA